MWHVILFEKISIWNLFKRASSEQLDVVVSARNSGSVRDIFEICVSHQAQVD